METVKIVVELVKAFADIAVDAFERKDPAAMKKVADVLPPDSPLKSEVVAEIQRQLTRAALEERD
jgi:hypothetical protein